MTSVAVIGSFRRFYPQILDTMAAFVHAGIAVTSPTGAAVVRDGEFVRFESDPDDWDNAQVQSVALAAIFKADVVFVVAPEGYVGRTTCYEIGHLYQARRPVIFSDPPKDLPIVAAHVMSADTLARRLADGEAFVS